MSKVQHRERTREEFAEALELVHPLMRAGQMKMLRAHFHARGQELTASKLARAANYQNYRGANLQYGQFGKLLRTALGVPRAEGRAPQLNVFADIVAWHPDGDYGLRLKREFFEALVDVGWFGTPAWYSRGKGPRKVSSPHSSPQRDNLKGRER